MTVLKRVLSPVLSNVLSSVLGDITRFFTTLVSAGSMYYSIPTVTLPGDYKKSALVYFTGTTLIIEGSSLNFDNRYRAQPGGIIDWRPENGSTTVATPSGTIPINKLSLVEVERIGSNGTIKVNGVTVFSGAVPTGTCISNVLGRSSASFSDGIVADSKISGASFASRFYPINEDLSTTTTITDIISGQNGTAVNISESGKFTLIDGDFLGVDLITQNVWENPSSADDQWTFANNQWTLTGLGNYNALRLLHQNDQPAVMILSGEVTNLSGNLGVCGTNSLLDLTTDGAYIRQVDIAADGDQEFKRGGGIVNATLDKPSLKQLLEVA